MKEQNMTQEQQMLLFELSKYSEVYGAHLKERNYASGEIDIRKQIYVAKHFQFYVENFSNDLAFIINQYRAQNRGIEEMLQNSEQNSTKNI